MSIPSNEQIVNLILSEIKDGNPFCDTVKCQQIVKSVYVINSIPIFNAFIVRMKKKYSEKRDRDKFTKYILDTFGASEGDTADSTPNTTPNVTPAASRSTSSQRQSRSSLGSAHLPHSLPASRATSPFLKPIAQRRLSFTPNHPSIEVTDSPARKRRCSEPNGGKSTQSTRSAPASRQQSPVRGRPKLSISGCKSRTTKRARADEACAKYCTEDLCHFLVQSLKNDGRLEEAQAVKRIGENKYNDFTKVTPVEAMSLLINHDIKKAGYQAFRELANAKGCKDLLPTYNEVSKAKAGSSVDIDVTPDGAHVDPQELIDATTKKVWQFMLTPEDREKVKPGDTLSMIWKTGCDGTTGIPVHQHKTDPVLGEYISTTSDIYMTSCVPLQLIIEGTGEVLWTNPRPNSTRLTRVFEFSFKKEDVDINRSTVEYLNGLNDTLRPTLIDRPVEEARVEASTSMGDLVAGVESLAMNCSDLPPPVACTHRLYCTMVDGKVKLHCSDQTSCTRSCPICGGTPTQLAKEAEAVKVISDKFDPGLIRMGLSPMHAWIKYFELISKMYVNQGTGYNVKKTEEDKVKVKAAKKELQQKLRSEIGIIVDCPAQGGSGNSNAGNTGRRFFEDAGTVAEILGAEFPVELLERCRNVLILINSMEPVDPDKLQQYCIETHTMLRDKFMWGMPPGVHVTLWHSHQFARLLPLPLGFWSEEAQESLNKIMKKFRRGHVRTDSEDHTNFDLMQRMLNASCPEVVSYSKTWNAELVRQPLPTELQALLVQK